MEYIVDIVRTISLLSKNAEICDMSQWCYNNCGPATVEWNLAILSNPPYVGGALEPSIFRYSFRNKEKAALFKLIWS